MENNKEIPTSRPTVEDTPRQRPQNMSDNPKDTVTQETKPNKTISVTMTSKRSTPQLKDYVTKIAPERITSEPLNIYRSGPNIACKPCKSNSTTNSKLIGHVRLQSESSLLRGADVSRDKRVTDRDEMAVPWRTYVVKLAPDRITLQPTNINRSESNTTPKSRKFSSAFKNKPVSYVGLQSEPSLFRGADVSRAIRVPDRNEMPGPRRTFVVKIAPERITSDPVNVNRSASTAARKSRKLTSASENKLVGHEGLQVDPKPCRGANVSNDKRVANRNPKPAQRRPLERSWNITNSGKNKRVRPKNPVGQQLEAKSKNNNKLVPRQRKNSDSQRKKDAGSKIKIKPNLLPVVHTPRLNPRKWKRTTSTPGPVRATRPVASYLSVSIHVSDDGLMTWVPNRRRPKPTRPAWKPI